MFVLHLYLALMCLLIAVIGGLVVWQTMRELRGESRAALEDKLARRAERERTDVRIAKRQDSARRASADPAVDRDAPAARGGEVVTSDAGSEPAYGFRDRAHLAAGVTLPTNILRSEDVADAARVEQRMLQDYELLEQLSASNR